MLLYVTSTLEAHAEYRKKQINIVSQHFPDKGGKIKKRDCLIQSLIIYDYDNLLKTTGSNTSELRGVPSKDRRIIRDSCSMRAQLKYQQIFAS